jgi:hypothetical protein
VRRQQKLQKRNWLITIFTSTFRQKRFNGNYKNPDGDLQPGFSSDDRQVLTGLPNQ